MIALTTLYYVVIAALIILGIVAAVAILTSIAKAIDRALTDISKRRKAVAIGTAPKSTRSSLPSSHKSNSVVPQHPNLIQSVPSPLSSPSAIQPLSSSRTTAAGNSSAHPAQAPATNGQIKPPINGHSVIICADAIPKQSTLQNSRYQITAVLGRGGFGITYLALDQNTKRQVAIKELFLQDVCSRKNGNELTVSSGNEAAFRDAKAKFLVEYETLSQFSSSAIVKIFGCFEENDTAYMVMEFLKGQTASEIVEVSGALDELKSLEVIKVVSKAVNLVHAKGLLHRDIHPRNIILCEDGSTKLIDFGLSKQLEQTAGLGTRRLNNTTSFGMPGYAPLEQYGTRGQLGHYTDVYALGATLYFLLTAKEPIPATDRALNDNLTPPHLVNRAVKTETSVAVMRAIQVNPNHRPQSVSEFLQLFQPKPQSQVKVSHPPTTQQNLGTNSRTTPATRQSNTSNPYVAPTSSTSAQQDAVRRVTAYYNNLIKRHPQNTIKLSKSRDWQINQCAQLTNAWIAKGFSYTESLGKWEDAARRAADAKVR